MSDQTLPRWGRYTELRPDALAAILAETPVAYVPWGALEWHGPHLPFGVDGMTAEAVCERAAARTGGVVLPVTWWPITALPHQFSISIPTDVLQSLWDALFGELARVGFRVVVLLSGHYAQGHELVLMDAAEHAMQQHAIRVLAVPPLALVDEQMLDHAAQWETAQMLALRPRLVDLAALGTGPLHPAQAAILGDDPRSATVGQGESALALGVEQLVASVSALLRTADTSALTELYARRRAAYQPYVERYFRTSWEQAIATWWAEKTAERK